MSAIQRGWERGRSVFDPSGDNGDATAGSGAGAAAPGSVEMSDATDSMPTVDPGAGQAADTGTSAGSAADQVDGGGASTRTHRSED